MASPTNIEELERRVSFGIAKAKAACSQGDYSRGFGWYTSYVEEGHGTQRTLIHLLGDHDRALDTISMFFNGREPLLSHRILRASLLNRKGYYLRESGDHFSAVHCFDRALWEIEKWERQPHCGTSQASVWRLVRKHKEIICRNRADAYFYLGSLGDAVAWNERGRQYSEGPGRDEYYVHSLVFEADIHSKRGDSEGALRLFKKATALQSQTLNINVLEGLRGFTYANFLLREGRTADARLVMEGNLKNAPRATQPRIRSLWYCIGGSIEAALGHHADAEKLFKAALQETNKIRVRGLEVIEAQHFYGKWLASQSGRYHEAIEWLEMAEDLAGAESGKGQYRLYLPEVMASIAIVKAKHYREMGAQSRKGIREDRAREECKAQAIEKAEEALKLGRAQGDGWSVARIEREFRASGLPLPQGEVYEIVHAQAYKLLVAAEYRGAAQEEGLIKHIEPLAHGTAWFIDSTLVATAAHVVARSLEWLSLSQAYRERHFPAQVRYLLLVGGKWVALTPVAKDDAADVALLRVSEPVDKPCVLRLAEPGAGVGIYDEWKVLGYPAKLESGHVEAAYEELALTGRISHLHESNSASKRIQLMLEEGQGQTWEGMSGAPVLVAGRVVGVFLSGYNTALRITFAAPAEAIRHLLSSVIVPE